MPLDYTWSYDPVFPESLFAHPLARRVLAQAGLTYEDPSNHVPAFCSPDTVAGLLALQPDLQEIVMGLGVSLAPHHTAQAGQPLFARTQWTQAHLAPLVARAQAAHWDGARLSRAVRALHAHARDELVRHTTTVDGDLRPDTARLAPYMRPHPPHFHLAGAMRALVGESPLLWKDRTSLDAPALAAGKARATMGATALLCDIPTTLHRHLSTHVPDLLERGRILSDAGSAALSFSCGRATLSLRTRALPMPADDLLRQVRENLRITTPPALAHMAHIHLRLHVPQGGSVSAAEARLLLRVAASFEGPGCVLDEADVFVPHDGLLEQLRRPAGWPVAATIGIKAPTPDLLVATGLHPRLGYGCAIAPTPAHPVPSHQDLHALCAWLLDTQPAFGTDPLAPLPQSLAYTPAWHRHSPHGRMLVCTPTSLFQPRP